MNETERILKGLQCCRDTIKEDLSRTDDPCDKCPFAANAVSCSPWEIYEASAKLITAQQDEILALRAALDKANEKLAYAWEDNPPYYDCEAGKELLHAWSEAWVHWFDVKEILPENDEDVLVTDGEDYAVGYYRSDCGHWDNDCFGWLEREEEDECPTRLGKVTHWKPFPKLGEHK